MSEINISYSELNDDLDEDALNQLKFMRRINQETIVSFVIGLLVGMIFAIIIVWILYVFRVFIFSYCPVNQVRCRSNDYFNDPGDALAHEPNLTADEILFTRGQTMFYRRVPRSSDCTPEGNQTVIIRYPQFCNFYGNGVDGVWMDTGFGENNYQPYGHSGPTIQTEGNCIPVDNPDYVNGFPLIRWEPNPFG